MNSKQVGLGAINRIAETHFFLRLTLVKTLKSYSLLDPGIQRLKFAQGKQNYHEVWISSMSDKFYDMWTIQRLGTEIELVLKFYYMETKGYANLLSLKSDPGYDLGAFQRLMPWQDNGVINLYTKELNIDLNKNPELERMQRLMCVRHLYAHNSGLLNDKFISDYKKLTGIDVITQLTGHTYPKDDTYYFEPLKDIDSFIESARKFVQALP